jgi:hypothetical protein
MITINPQNEPPFSDQIMHESLTALTIVSARLQLLRKRVASSDDSCDVPLERSLRDAELLISDRASRIHALAAGRPALRPSNR